MARAVLTTEPSRVYVGMLIVTCVAMLVGITAMVLEGGEYDWVQKPPATPEVKALLKDLQDEPKPAGTTGLALPVPVAEAPKPTPKAEPAPIVPPPTPVAVADVPKPVEAKPLEAKPAEPAPLIVPSGPIPSPLVIPGR